MAFLKSLWLEQTGKPQADRMLFAGKFCISAMASALLCRRYFPRNSALLGPISLIPMAPGVVSFPLLLFSIRQYTPETGFVYRPGVRSSRAEEILKPWIDQPTRWGILPLLTGISCGTIAMALRRFSAQSWLGKVSTLGSTVLLSTGIFTALLISPPSKANPKH